MYMSGIISLIAASLAVGDALVCYHGICDRYGKQMPLECPGSVIKGGGLCGCYDVCAKQEGEECQAEWVRGRIPLGTCDTGLSCQHQPHMRIGAGACVKAHDSQLSVSGRSTTRTVCEEKRIHSMLVMVVYPGQWFPRCDADGLFLAQQCDNQGMCFCVDRHTGVVDQSTKVLGSADCGSNESPSTTTAPDTPAPDRVVVRSTQTLCERKRIQSMIVMIVYPGQWFPKCDAEGLFESEQCDNQGMCFCVDVHTGTVDESTKIKGTANCGETQTQSPNASIIV